MGSWKIHEDSLPERLRVESHGHCGCVTRALNVTPVSIVRDFAGGQLVGMKTEMED